MDASDARPACERILQSVGDCVVADDDFLETLLTGILARGHILIEDVPGTGKTLTARTFATVLGLSFNRIQFTPDLLPADVTGTHVYREDAGTFEFTEGPVFANLVLADEINRAPPKTQAALLEAMAEGQVTVDGDTHTLPDPFVVVATQNPVESEGVFPLPEAQRDRFLVKTDIGYPDQDDEQQLLRRRTNRDAAIPAAERLFDQDAVRELQSVPESVTVADDVVRYITAVARETRDDARVDVGCSPRGTQRLLEASRARAVFDGRSFVRPVDVETVAQPVLAHRLVLTTDATVDGVTAETIVTDALDRVPVPSVSETADTAHPD